MDVSAPHNPVRQSAQYVVKHAQHVDIDRQAIKQLAQQLLNMQLTTPKWDDIDYLRLDNPEMQLRYIMVLEAHNFCTWHPDPDHLWHYQAQDGKIYRGWYGTVKAINQAYTADIPILDANYLATFSEDNFYNIYGYKGQLLLIEERIAIFRELGEVILEQYDNRILTMIDQSGGDIRLLWGQLIGCFLSYRDKAIYDDQQVYFYKRTQHLIMDIWGLLKNHPTWDRAQMSYLTILADYKISQILREYHVLKYSDSLVNIIGKQHEILSGDPLEIEIRAATIIAGDILLEELRKTGNDILPFELDINLWIYAHHPKTDMQPFHRTRSIWY